MAYLELIAGFAFLVAGGELLVRGAVAVARRAGLSELMIGLTLVGFGTSTPELVASLDAALAGSPGIALGNVVGSNVANVFLILGVGALLRPMRTTREAFARDGLVLLGISVLLAAACQLEVIGRSLGASFLALLFLYTFWTYRAERRAPDPAADVYAAEAGAVGQAPPSLLAAVGLSLAGILGVVAGAHLMVDAAIKIARAWAVSEAVIGVTLVALGTSLPELATTVVAAYRRASDVAFGNVIGSNIFNVLGIAGVTALVHPLEVPAEIARFHVWIMLGSTGFLIAFAMTGWRVVRAEGGALVLAYVAYLVLAFG